MKPEIKVKRKSRSATAMLHPLYNQYAITRDGRVFSLQRGIFLKGSNSMGYKRVAIYHGGKTYYKYIYILVLETFCGPRPKGFDGAHLNGKRHDNRIRNLKWVTRKENQSHKARHGTLLMGSKSPVSKLTEKQVISIREKYFRPSFKVSNSVKLAKEFGVSVHTIQKVVNRSIWKHV